MGFNSTIFSFPLFQFDSRSAGKSMAVLLPQWSTMFFVFNWKVVENCQRIFIFDLYRKATWRARRMFPVIFHVGSR